MPSIRREEPDRKHGKETIYPQISNSDQLYKPNDNHRRGTNKNDFTFSITLIHLISLNLRFGPHLLSTYFPKTMH